MVGKLPSTDIMQPERMCLPRSTGAHMYNLFADLAENESGATAIEYGLIAALISVAIIAVITTIGTSLTATFGNVSGNLK